MLTIKAALNEAAAITAISDSARLDVELLLCHAIEKQRTYLYTWPDTALTEQQATCFGKLLERRKTGEPIAHILGYREFWSLPLQVNASTLIPRPATEALIEWILIHCQQSHCKVLDLGTGTGAIALALGKENSSWTITGLDLSSDAVTLAKKNAENLNIDNCTFLSSNWFSAVKHEQFNLIVSNPPYIDPLDPHLTQGDVRFEPLSALVANEGGLADLRHIINSSIEYLNPNGILLLEHGYNQSNDVQAMLIASGFIEVGGGLDLEGHQRFAFGRRRDSSHE